MAKRGEITKRAVDALRPNESKDTFLWDGKVSGFGLRCRPSGSKYYFIKMRAARRQRWLTIVEHGSPWTAETARSEALRLLGKREAGKNPAAERDIIKENPTVEELGKLFVVEHAKAKLKPRTAEEYDRLLVVVVKPKLGNMSTCDVTHADIASLHFKLRSTPYQANKTVALLKKMFNWAKRRGVQLKDHEDPATGIELYKEQKRRLFLSAEQLTQLGVAMRELEKEDQIKPQEAAAIRLLLFTGCRLSEILTLRWVFVDKQKRTLELLDSKTGAKTVQLSARLKKKCQKRPMAAAALEITQILHF